MTPKICGNCKHLGEAVTNYSYETDKDEPTSYFVCGLIKRVDRSELKSGQVAKLQDGSDYYARLLVESDFGCNLFEGK